MAVFFRPVLFLLLCSSIALFFSTTTAQTCRSQTFSSNRVFQTCNDLPVLNSFLHWSYNSSTRTANIAYRHTGVTSSTWVAWAINPTSTGMLGAQSLVAFQGSDGRMSAYTSPISSYNTGLQRGNLSFAVPSITAEFGNNEITIFATLVLQSATVNQVWQEGPLSGNNPGAHPLNPANRQSTGTVNFESGETRTTTEVIPRLKRKNTHGVLNAVGWGTLLPLGAIIARYLKVVKSADPAWFYLHIACQTSAYAVGVAGWATGIKLGSDSPGIQYNPHRNIGIAVFALATLQVFALLLRPKPDHKIRFYWNIYHHLTGYVVIILSIVNIFKGFDILQPEKKWKKLYIGVLIGLGVFAVQLEVLTWIIVIRRKRSTEKSHHGMNGANGYDARTQQGV